MTAQDNTKYDKIMEELEKINTNIRRIFITLYDIQISQIDIEKLVNDGKKRDIRKVLRWKK